MMHSKRIQITALALLIMTAGWVVLMALSTNAIQPGWSDAEYAAWAAGSGTVYSLTYLNATLLTLLVLPLFVFLYLHSEGKYRPAALTGLFFVPVYQILNLVAYSLQIRVVPELAGRALAGDAPLQLAVQLMQVNPASLMGFLNGLAYGILGIPSILYGWILIRSSRKGSGWFLLLNGIACIAGFGGYLSGSHILTQGVVAGGVLFLVSLLMMALEFRRPAATAP